jgi:CheY-like chemotaxis protein
MSSRGSRFSPLEKTLADASPSGTPGAKVPAVICGPNEDTRLLLRGLLRLHRHPVVWEARTLGDLEQMPPSTETRILLLDVEAEDGAWNVDLARALQSRPGLRAVVILPVTASDAAPRALSAGARAALSRPFAIQDLVKALGKAVS